MTQTEHKVFNDISSGGVCDRVRISSGKVATGYTATTPIATLNTSRRVVQNISKASGLVGCSRYTGISIYQK